MASARQADLLEEPGEPLVVEGGNRVRTVVAPHEIKTLLVQPLKGGAAP